MKRIESTPLHRCCTDTSISFSSRELSACRRDFRVFSSDGVFDNHSHLRLVSCPIRGDVKKKNFSLRSTETWMLSLASSPVSLLEGVRSWSFWVRRVLQRDQPS